PAHHLVARVGPGAVGHVLPHRVHAHRRARLAHTDAQAAALPGVDQVVVDLAVAVVVLAVARLGEALRLEADAVLVDLPVAVVVDAVARLHLRHAGGERGARPVRQVVVHAARGLGVVVRVALLDAGARAEAHAGGAR